MGTNSRHEKAPVLAGAEALDNVNRTRKNVEMNNSTVGEQGNLPIMRHSGMPVMTTALLAKEYAVETTLLINNYQRNQARFLAGVHFFKIEGEELKSMKDSISQRDAVGEPLIKPKAKSLMLWTERGAARHAKMLDTDKAWEVFGKLEDSYFVKQPVSGSALPVATIQTLIGTVIGSDGEHVLDQVIDQKANALPAALRRSFKHTIKSRLRTRFSVQKTALIPAEELANACNFVAAYVFEGDLLLRKKPVQVIGEPLKRYLVAFNHKGEQSIDEVPKGAYVLSQHELMAGMVATPGDIPVSIPDMFQFLMAAVVNLKCRYEYMARREAK